MGQGGSALSRLLNIVLYQTGWFACVLLAAVGRGSTGALLALALVAVHLALATKPGAEVRLIVGAAALGLMLESWHVNSGWVRYASPGAVTWLAPPWIVVLWIQFATLLRYGLSWMGRRFGWIALIGAVAGPLSFLAGQRLGAAEFPRGTLPALVLLGISWALALPALVALAHRSYPVSGTYRGIGTRPRSRRGARVR